MVAVTEGGYDLKALADSLRASIGALEATDPSDFAAADGAAPRGDATIAAVTPHLAEYWKL